MVGKGQKRVLLLSNSVWNLVNFREGLIRSLVEIGFDVVIAAPADRWVSTVLQLGCRFIPLPIDSHKTSPVADSFVLYQVLAVLRRERPDIVLAYTIKPNVYGSIAAMCLGIPIINNISGLGTAFIRTNWTTSLVTQMYRVALARSNRVFFQNRDDMAFFVDSRIVRKEIASLLPGSGVNLIRFRPRAAAAPKRGAACFLLIGRMIWDKGVQEFIDAARLVRLTAPDTRFQLLGFLEVKNRTAISRVDVEKWVEEGIVEYLGATDDVRPSIAEADCVVLPSYREGTPRTLLEAAAMGKPLIATDVPGCREVVVHARNGYLCEARSAADLAAKMQEFLSLSDLVRQQMGKQSRRLVEKYFDEKIVVEEYLEAISRAISKSI